MKTQSSSWHVVIQVVGLVLVWICYVNAQSQCSCLSTSGGNGDCGRCHDGCFLSDIKCFRCPDQCYSYLSASYCDQCQTGFYGATCNDLCRSNCITCTSYWTCTTCKTGYFFSYCQYPCSYCKDSMCYKDTGYCMNGCLGEWYPSTSPACCPSTCSSCDSYSNCTACKVGYFGLRCQFECSNCISNTCNKDNGQCTYGCTDGYYQPHGQYCYKCSGNCPRCNSYTDCTLCKAKYYGPSCASKCDPNCEYGFCNQNTGECTNGCVEGYYQNGTKCLKCQIDFCQTCTPDNMACNVCQDGYFVFNGNCTQCRSVCVNSKCDKTDGSCSEGCTDRFTGRHCNDQCYPNCNACKQYNMETCTSCKAGYYGQKCENNCNTQCKDKEGVRPCAKTNGECTQGCENGYTGSTCSERCNLNCISCEKNDKLSCDSCNQGYYGPSCKQTCNSTCYNLNNGSSVCDKQTGKCLRSCTPAMCESIAQDQSVGSSSAVTTPVIIGVAIGVVACLVLFVTGIIIFVLVRRKRRNMSNAEQTNVAMENNPVLDHADQERTTDYTALHTLRGQPQEVQVISSPPTDGNNATYVNAEDTSTEPAKDSYENVFI